MPHVHELHEQHDALLVVSLASGDFATADRDRAIAQSLIDSCGECARLHDDVVAIARSTKALPTPPRPRDFQLTPEQAAGLRPGGWRRLAAAFSARGSIFSRQLGVGLATLGVAGLLLSSLGSISLGGLGGAASPSAAPGPNAAAAPAYEAAGSQPAAALAPASPAASAAAASSQDIRTAVGGGPATESPGLDTSGGGDTGVGRTGDSSGNVTPTPTPHELIALAPSPDSARDAASSASGDGSGPSGLVVLSVVLLGAGLVVLLLRSISRRVAAR